MKLSKKIFAVILAVLFASICFFQTTSNAADVRYFGIKAIRTRTEPNLGYAITNPNSGGTKLWNIVEYDSETSTTFKNTGAYCMKAGVGFTGVNASGTNVNGSETYNKSFNMLTQRTDIAAQNDVLKGLVEGGQYNRLLAILDLIYVPGVSTETDKANLLKNAGIYPEAWDFTLTDDDIEAIQQAAIWYFTNIEEPELFDKTAAIHWLNYTTDGNVYKSLADYKKTAERKTSEGWQRVDQAELLYNYLINTAKANESQYVNPKEVKAPVTVDTTTLSYEQVGKNYIVGPIHMTKNNDIPYTIEATLKNGSTDITDYKLLDSDKKETTKTISELVGNDFYYSIPVNGITEINVSYKVKYTISGMTLWASTTNDQAQPIAVVEKQNKEPETKLSVTPKEKVFDLALRKYITAINDTAITDTRAPSIDEATLLTGTTATYKHRKDPVVIKNNDYVTYNLTVYNEGEFSGRATKIIDQLPEGLEFDSVVSGDYEKEFYDTTLNKLTLNKKGESNLDPYSEGNLDSETVTIKCKVTAVADTTSDKILTNVAWISEEYNAETEEIIRTEVGKDRDSEPGTTPIVKKDNMSGYKGNASNKEVTPADSNYFYKGEQDDDDFEKLKLEAIAPEGKYSVFLVKEDKNGVQLNSEATFKINDEEKAVVGRLTIADQKQIESIETPDVYVIKETKAPDKYCEFDGIITVTANKEEKDSKYVIKSIDYKVEDKDGNDITAQTGDTVSVELKNGNIYVHVKDYQFDLALRKYITKVNGENVANSRVPNINLSELNDNTSTTATYNHRKDPVKVKTGDIVTYNLTVYNEGDFKGRATKIVDQLPTGLKFTDVISGDYEKESYNEDTNQLILKKKSESNLDEYKTNNLDSETIEIECEVTEKVSTETDKVLTNVAWISEEYNADKKETITTKEGADRDSEPATKPDVNKDNMSDYKGKDNKSELDDSNYFYKGEQDDDDFEKLIIQKKEFDLKLIKRITEVNGQKIDERIKSIDVSKLNIDSGANTTADYELNKDPVYVSTGDLVKYTLRVYNEGYLDGYASEITEDLPEGVKFVYSTKTGQELEDDPTFTAEEKEAIKFNQSMLWTYDSENDKLIKTTYLSKNAEGTPGENLIKAFGANDGTKTENDLSYKEVSVIVKVTASNEAENIIRNEACISEDSDSEGNDVKDRDSDPHNWVKYEDDEDYDNIVLKSFDLSLRKFITAVSSDDEITEKSKITSRIPNVDTSKLNTIGNDGKLITTATYNHTKEPLQVTIGDLVEYTIRVYNEGETDGYAAEIKDHLPKYLEFVSDNEINKEYGWKVSDDGRTVTTTYLDDTKLGKATKNEGTYVLKYADVKIVCKVTDEAQSNDKITNIADITKYEDENKKEVKDRDSEENNVELPKDEKLPTYKDDEKGSYIPGQEDDDDFEKVIVKIFDLGLRKWVSQAIVIENGTGTVTETGHTPYDNPEDIVKVEINRKDWKNVTVKFRFGIRVFNQGDIAGYPETITDFVPEGLVFDQAENPNWTEVSPNVIMTDALNNTYLQPGEYADIDVLLTWVNEDSYVGLVMDNVATMAGKSDDAATLVSITTGQNRIYYILGTVVLVTLAGGVFLIKKYVLK